MSLFIASLNSGSSGNCYYVGNQQEAVLIDAGISCREVEQRMKNLGLKMEVVKAIFISHEHTDHIRGLDRLARKYMLPVYITQATRSNTRLALRRIQILNFKAEDSIAIGALSVIPFSKKHDAADPFSFVVQHGETRVGVITDIGIACREVIHYFRQCHACFLETNYDERMLDEGSYPLRLKNRIRGGYGHLSNRQALELFIKHRPSYMTHLILSHLSQNNNHPEIVSQLFMQHAGSTRMVIASRHKETEVYEISHPQEVAEAEFHVARSAQMVQMTLFD